MTKAKNEIIKDIMRNHSGDVIMSRDVSVEIHEQNPWGLSNKSVGRRLMILEDEGFVNRIKYNPSEANTYGCRYAYKWVPPEDERSDKG